MTFEQPKRPLAEHYKARQAAIDDYIHGGGYAGANYAPELRPSYDAGWLDAGGSPSVLRKCFDCDDGSQPCHMNCGPRAVDTPVAGVVTVGRSNQGARHPMPRPAYATTASDHNPVLQFVVEAHGRLPQDHEFAGLYVLAGGAWLVCNKPHLWDEGMLTIKKGDVLFRDYWSLVCYDDGCSLSQTIKAAGARGLSGGPQ